MPINLLNVRIEPPTPDNPHEYLAFEVAPDAPRPPVVPPTFRFLLDRQQSDGSYVLVFHPDYADVLRTSPQS